MSTAYPARASSKQRRTAERGRTLCLGLATPPSDQAQCHEEEADASQKRNQQGCSLKGSERNAGQGSDSQEQDDQAPTTVPAISIALRTAGLYAVVGTRR